MFPILSFENCGTQRKKEPKLKPDSQDMHWEISELKWDYHRGLDSFVMCYWIAGDFFLQTHQDQVVLENI